MILQISIYIGSVGIAAYSMSRMRLHYCNPELYIWIGLGAHLVIQSQQDRIRFVWEQNGQWEARWISFC